MAEAQLRLFLDKVRQLNAFVAMSEADPSLWQELRDCEHHDQVVALARRCGFEIGRRWGEPPPADPQADAGSGATARGATARPADLAMPITLSDPEAAAPSHQARFPEGVGTASALLPCSEGPPGPEVASALSRSQPSDPLPASVLEKRSASSAGPPQSSRPTQDVAPPQRSALGESLLGCPPDREAAADGLLSPCDRPRALFAGPCPPPGQEHTEVLIRTPQWRLERIHSCSCASPAGFWYEQSEDEWVMLLQGTAALRFADQPADQALRPGDSLWIRAGRRHRVTATDPAPGTIWLALFWPPA